MPTVSGQLLMCALLATEPTWKSQVEEADALRVEGDHERAFRAYSAAYRGLPPADRTSVVGSRMVLLALGQARASGELPILREALALTDEARAAFLAGERPWPDALESQRALVEAELASALERSVAAQGPEPRASTTAVERPNPDERSTAGELPNVDDGASTGDDADTGDAARATEIRLYPVDRSEGPVAPASRSHRGAHIAYWTSATVLAAAGVGLIVGGSVMGDGSQEVEEARASPAYEALMQNPQAFASFSASMASWQQQRRAGQIAMWTCGGIALAAGVSLAIVDLVVHRRRRPSTGLGFRF